MGSRTDRSVIPFAPAARSAGADGVDQVDKAGQTILGLLHKAAGVAEANSQRAVELAQKFSHQLRAAEDRIAELEAEVGMYQEKADRAEQWLHKCTLRLRTDFSDKPTSRGEPLNAGGVSTVRAEWRVE